MSPGPGTAVTILHFNDCYNVESRREEPVGGAARFATALRQFSHLDPLILFSGDIIAPSIMSTFTKGEQMLPVLNSLNIHCAVYGNHEFDFGVEHLSQFAAQTSFPWLMSNVLDTSTQRPLAEGRPWSVMFHGGRKFGLVGLVEEEWLATLATIEPDDVTYLDFVAEGRRLARFLKDKPTVLQEKVDYVIALTHMRTPNDSRLAANVDEIDLILGGHDHDYEIKKVNDKLIVKSGTDFRQFSRITLDFSRGTEVGVEVEAIDVTSEYAEDPTLAQQLEQYKHMVEGKMDDVLGVFHTDLDGRFSVIRTQESNLGNFVADVMLSATHSDLALLNSGTLRSDCLHPRGDFTLRDLVTVLPMMDSLIVLNVTGEVVWKCLENGVSQYPSLEGRFPQVSGVKFSFDPSRPPGQRVNPRYIKVGDEYLDLEQKYRLVTKSYMHKGRDGYDMLKDAEVLMGEDESPELRTAIQNHFQAIKVVTGAVHQKSRHRQSLVCLSRRHSIVKMYGEGPALPRNPLSRGFSLDAAGRRGLFLAQQKPSIDKIEHEQCLLEPRVEGRIRIHTEEVNVHSLSLPALPDLVLFQM
ncbi:hypothetical protein LAZ67_8000291 [Cordylochernes scorpioides]|uniref:5'-nucleotidase n=1 Tax=Cordylochernes scorpioides TaxID=51811 RepID=A0ABY6KPA5_9ARAC|nr:hypothetical protein LAZ67_8000291 [Cordylochernes scorpioides]